MSRILMTVAEKNKAAAAEKQQQWNEVIANWTAKFIKLMYLYPKTSRFHVDTKDENTFIFVADDGDGGYVPRFELPIKAPELQDWMLHYTMEDAFRAITEHDEREAEERRKYQVKENARKRLQEVFSKEERQLLGLE